MKEFLKKVRVNVKIHNEIPDFFEGSSRSAINIAIANVDDNYYLLYEIPDFMDEEALILEEAERQAKIENDERLRVEEENRIKHEIEQQRIQENDLMKIEEHFLIRFLRKEIELQRSEEQIMKNQELFGIRFMKIENKLKNQANAAMIKEENRMSMFIYKERELAEIELTKVNSEEVKSKKFIKQEQKKQADEFMKIESEEKKTKNFMLTEDYISNANIMKMEYEERQTEFFLIDENEIIECEFSQMECEEIVSKGFSGHQEKKQFSELIFMSRQEQYIIQFNRQEANIRSRETRQMENEEKLRKQLNFLDQQEKRESELLEALKVYEYKLQQIESAEKKRLLRQRSMIDSSSPAERLSISITSITSSISPFNSIDCSPIPFKRSMTLNKCQDSVIASPDTLVMESQLLSVLEITCGACFCKKCHHMLKRSSLFLKCSSCCDTAFLQALPRPSDVQTVGIPFSSRCCCCNEVIVRGEVIRCVCCYIRSEFLRDFSETECKGCGDLEENHWVDICVGENYQLIPCKVCKKHVNYSYMIEVCSRCHERICLFCLRTDPFLAVTVCSKCNSRRVLNPIKKRGSQTFA